MKTVDLVEEIFRLSNCDFVDEFSFEDIVELHELLDSNSLWIQTKPARTGKRPQTIFVSETDYNTPKEKLRSTSNYYSYKTIELN
jgi:hypothetical protein